MSAFVAHPSKTRVQAIDVINNVIIRCACVLLNHPQSLFNLTAEWDEQRVAAHPNIGKTNVYVKLRVRAIKVICWWYAHMSPSVYQ